MHRKGLASEAKGLMPQPKLYSIAETSRLLGIGQASIYALMRSGRLKKTKILGRTLVAVAEIDRFLAERGVVLKPPIERILEGKGVAEPQVHRLRLEGNPAGRPINDPDCERLVQRKPVDLATALAAGPVEPVLRCWLIRLLDEFYDATDLSMSAICSKVCGGDPNLYDGLKGGHKTFTAYTFDRSVAGLSDNWPADLPWPEGIPRFGANQVRAKSRVKRAPAEAIPRGEAPRE